jgi:hypothetical protein
MIALSRLSGIVLAAGASTRIPGENEPRPSADYSAASRKAMPGTAFASRVVPEAALGRMVMA